MESPKNPVTVHRRLRRQDAVRGELKEIRLALDDNATVFYPRAIPKRANGRNEFEKSFKVIFELSRSASPQIHNCIHE